MTKFNAFISPFKRVRKVANGGYCLRYVCPPSVLPSDLPHGKSQRPLGRIFMRLCTWSFIKSLEKIQVWLTSDKNSRCITQILMCINSELNEQNALSSFLHVYATTRHKSCYMFRSTKKRRIKQYCTKNNRFLYTSQNVLYNVEVPSSKMQTILAEK